MSLNQFFFKYFLVILTCIALAGVLLYLAGTQYGLNVLSALGLAVFSSCVIGILFKWLSLDMFLNTQLRSVLIERGYISQLDEKQILQSLGSHYTEYVARRGLPSQVQQLMPDVLGRIEHQPFRENYVICITVQVKEREGIRYLWLSVDRSYEVTGKIGSKIFPDENLVWAYHLDIPEALTAARDEEVFSFNKIEMKLDNTDARKKVDYKRTGNVLDWKVVSEEDRCFGEKPVEVRYFEEYAVEPSDIFSQRMMYFTNNIRVDCHHPESVEVYGYPFVTPNFNQDRPRKDLYTLRVKGLAWPGNGFALFFKTKQ
jgi:hypothetical protein